MAESLASHLLPQWRESRGLKQGEAAKLIGVSQPMLSEYESGKKTPRTILALKIEKLTGGFVPVNAWGKPPPKEDKPVSPPRRRTGTEGR